MSGERRDLAQPLMRLHVGFWGCVVSFGLAMGADRLFGVGIAAAAADILLAAFVACALLYWTCLAILAHRTGRNWLLWVAAGLVTLAIGFVVTYALMVSRVRSPKPAEVDLGRKTG